jgi:hypothetical protein
MRQHDIDHWIRSAILLTFSVGVSCRRSKLKASRAVASLWSPPSHEIYRLALVRRGQLTSEQCTGENPCQRCMDNGKRCFYSEDQTAAEVLQNLSRPTTNPGPQGNSNATGIGSGSSRQNLMPRNDAGERRVSDAGNMALTMEERMTRIEKMMEALIHERGLAFTSTGSIEREQSVGFRSESAFSMPLLDPIHPALDHVVQQLPEQMQHSVLLDAPDMDADAPVFVRVGEQSVPFPSPGRFQQYVAHFFGNIHLRHPCVDEASFNARVQPIVTDGSTGPSDVYFLALCYAIFACCDAVIDVSPPPCSNDSTKSPGWQWAQLAEGIVDKTSLHGGDDGVTMLQYLLFQVRRETSASLCPIDISRLYISPIRTCQLEPMPPHAQPPQLLYNKIYINNRLGWGEIQFKRTGGYVSFGTCICPIASSRFHAGDHLL